MQAQGENYTVTDQNDCITMMLFGSYHADQREFARAERPIYHWLRTAKKTNQKFVLAKPHEPNLLWSLGHQLYPREERFIFDIIHDHIANTGFDPNMFRFVSGNPHASESYAGWCNSHHIDPQQQIHVVSRAFWVKFFDEVRNDFMLDMQSPKTHYFTMLNRTYREHKGILLINMIEQGLMEPEYSDKFHKSFSFFDIADSLLQQYPAAEQYFCSLELEDADEFELEKTVIETINTDPMEHATQSSLFDFVVDYCQSEDLGKLNLERYKKTFPWWKENIISEKTLRNMYYGKPFMRLGEPESLLLLRENYGFKTFHGVLFDETYDTIKDEDERIQAMVHQVKHIMDTYTLEQLHDKIMGPEVQEILHHNQQRFQTILHYLENSTGIFSWTEHVFLNNSIQNQ